jgi:predicted TIM-barrel fold metal-dependent hydrolase
MIIDADVHLSPTPEQGLDATIETTLKKMERAGVDRALTWLIPPYLRQIDAGNAYVYNAVRSHPDRFLGFGWADPNLGVEKAKDAVMKCVYDYGFHGVKLNGAQNSFFIDDPKLSLPVVEEIAKTGKLLAFHVGTDAFEFTHPFRVGKIARLYPELRILAVHMGGVGHADVTNAMIETAEQCPNITLIGSAVRMPAVWKAISTLGASRVCYGSDTPFDIMHAALGAYRALLADLPEQDRDLVLGGNIARLFGL